MLLVQLLQIPYKSAITPSSPTLDILRTLDTLLRMQTRVFLVHMNAPLGSRFFIEANKAKMLTEDFAWIVTNGLSSLVNPTIDRAAFAMEGVVGVRPFISMASPNLNETMIAKKNLFCLWAYDTVTALATVVEEAWPPEQSESKRVPVVCGLNFTTTTTSKFGNKILQGMRNLRIANGLSGNFHLVNGQLQSSTFDVFNVVGNKEQVIGYWTSKHGLSKDSFVTGRDYSTSKEDMQAPIWPGRTRNAPKGWVVISVKGEKEIKIGVPLRSGFQEFFRIEWDQHTDEPIYSGFAYDVFRAVLGKLPFALPYKFVPFMNESRQSSGTYSQMLFQISQKKVDAVVGDVTITAERSLHVDFTEPYSETGVRMLVAFNNNNGRSMWIFLAPFSLELWLTTALAFIGNGFVVWILERHHSNEDFNGPWHKKLELSLWFSFSTLVFAQRERVVSNWTRLVVVVWVFMVLIITQSYAANLSSFLTAQRLQQPMYMDAEILKAKGYRVGYQSSFVRDEILVGYLGFSNDSLLVSYESVEQYNEALSNGLVAAIFDEIPYIRVFLAKYCGKFVMMGPTYNSSGFGFAFPRNSTLVPEFSRAIFALKTKDSHTSMEEIENRNGISRSSCKDSDYDAVASNSDHASFTLYDFGGLFIIVGAVALFSICGDFIHSNWHVLLPTLQNWYRQIPIILSRIPGMMVHTIRGSLELCRGNSVPNHDQSTSL